MKLHRNAALSWSGRRLLAERVVVQGWTLAAAAEAAGVSVRCARKWVGRYRLEGESGLLDRSSAPRRVANRTPDDRVAAILRLRQLRMTAAEIAETLSMPLSTVSAVLRRNRVGRLGRLGLEQPPTLRALTTRRARAHRRQEARPHRAWCRSPHVAQALHATPNRWQRPPARHRRLGVRPRCRRRSQPPGLRRSAPRRESDNSSRLPPSGTRLLQPPLTAGSGTTTIDDDTQPSAANPRSAEPTSLGPTPRRRPAMGRAPPSVSASGVRSGTRPPGWRTRRR
jgi:transposase